MMRSRCRSRARARRGRHTWMTPISPKLPVRFSLGCVSAKYARKSAIWKPEPVMTRAASLRGMGDAAVSPAWRWACGCAPELWAAQNCGPATTEARQESHCFGPASAHLDERVREAQEGAAGRRDQQRDEDHGPSADPVRQRTQQRRQHGLADPHSGLQDAVISGTRAGLLDQEWQHGHQQGVAEHREQDDHIRPAQQRDWGALVRVPRLGEAEWQVDGHGHPHLFLAASAHDCLPVDLAGVSGRTEKEMCACHPFFGVRGGFFKVGGSFITTTTTQLSAV